MRGVEAGDVVTGEGANGVGGADGGFAVRLVAVEEARADAAGGCDDGVALLRDADETLLADALDVVGVEGWMEDDVGKQVECGVGVVREEGDGGGGGIHCGGGCEACAYGFGVFCELGGVAGFRAFVEQGCRHGG